MHDVVIDEQLAQKRFARSSQVYGKGLGGAIVGVLSKIIEHTVRDLVGAFRTVASL
ncbi:hypothetical protein D3C81_2145720 [compost metagenome]